MTASTPPRTAPTKKGAAALRGAPAPRRVSLWNLVYRRRIAGNSAPMEHNLAKYLMKHPECEIFCGQDSKVDTWPYEPGTRRAASARVGGVPAAPPQKRVTLWHKMQKRKIVGNAAPLEKNVAEYLRKHPEYEVYDANGQLGERDVQRAVEKVLGAIVTSVANQNRRSPGQTSSSTAARCTGTEPSKPSKPSKLAKPSAKRRRKHHMSGGKQLRGTKASARAAKRRMVALAAGQVQDEREKQERQMSLSVLLDIASRAAVPQAVESAPEEPRGMLDLLVQATQPGKHCDVSIEQDATMLVGASTPESPPFSPIMGPAAAEQFLAIQELCLAAPSPAKKSQFHRLAAQ
jgi:hypothetical protein|eukprot:COSAG01_NODE_9696_length_2367_cov_6.925044_1_plen_347_part_00